MAEIIEAKDGSHFVRSRSVPSAFRHVEGYTCQCPGFGFNGTCWHISQVGRYVAEHRERRPAVPVHPGLVDER